MDTATAPAPAPDDESVPALDWKGWYSIAVIVAGFAMLVRDVVGPDFVMLGMLSMMMVAKIITVDEALEGFSNEGLLTVAVLFVVAAGISETGGLDYYLSKLLGQPSTTSSAQIRLMLPIAFVSAFLNNTPVVAIMIPIVLSWCQKADLPPGQLFMPLSFASILGGTITLIGTSTNLVIKGLQEDRFPDEPPIGLFDLGLFGVPVALTGMIYIVLFSPWLLPGESRRSRRRTSSGQGTSGVDDQLIIGLQVRIESPCVGQSIAEAGLRGLPGLYLASVRRGGLRVHAVGPEFILAAGDILFFAGDLNEVQGLVDTFKLQLLTDESEEDIPALMGSPKHRPAVELVCEAPRSALQQRLVSDDLDNTLLRHRHHSLDPQQAIKPVFTRASVAAPVAPTSSSQAPCPMPRSSTLSGPLALPSSSLRPLRVAAPVSLQSRLLTAHVKQGAPVIGQSIREVGFRSRFSAAIVALRRNGERVCGKLGDVRLMAGDEVVLDTGDGFDANSPDLQENLDHLNNAGKKAENEFMIAMQVVHGARMIGKTVEAAGLRGLPETFLFAIERASGETVHAVSPCTIIEEGDVMWFAGSVQSVPSLRKIPGLEPHGDQVEKLTVGKLQRRLVQVVISSRSPMLHKTIRDVQFRSRFDAAVIAVHREGRRLRTKIGDIELGAGDVLILDTGPNFVSKYRTDRNFLLVAEVENSQPPRFDRVLLASLVAIVMIGVFTAGVVDLITAALIASGIMLFTGCLSGDQARAAVKWEVVTTIAAAFGLSTALEKTFVAANIANALVDAGQALGGEIFIMSAIYIATVLLSQVVANNAAAALMFPIAARVAQQEGIDQTQMSYLLMLAASASFASPFGYQTNLMVYAAGGYQFMDFVRFGGPMQVWQAIVSIAVIALKDLWPIFWAVSIVAAVLVFAGPAVMDCVMSRGRSAKHEDPVDVHTVTIQGPLLGRPSRCRTEAPSSPLKPRQVDPVHVPRSWSSATAGSQAHQGSGTSAFANLV